jgi:6-phosphogluconolactonase
MPFKTPSFRRVASLLLTLSTAFMLASVVAIAEDSNSGFVYVMTNQASDNSVIQFQRGDHGLLTRTQEMSTRGMGSGGSLDPLGSQDSLVLSGDGRLLFAVNAGSNEISVLGIGANGLEFLSKTASGGTFPASVALHEDMVYVLNSHGIPNVKGFRLQPDGNLTPIPNATRNLPGGTAAAPADVKFSQDGTLLLVTETATNQIDVFRIRNNGTADGPVVVSSPGAMPFGFAFAQQGRPIVAEAGTGSVSSYNITDNNTLTVMTPALRNGQLASCWISLTHNKSYAYVSNTASGTISSYRINPHGDLRLLKAVAANPGAKSAPIDSSLSNDSRFLYVLSSTQGRIMVFGVNGSSLQSLDNINGLPKSIQGIAAQ